MDPQLQSIGVHLADALVRNTATTVGDRIRKAKSERQKEETISELEQIVSDLLSDKNDLIRIAQAYEEQLVAQRISNEDIEYISTNIIPVVKQLAQLSDGGDDPSSGQVNIDLLASLLSVETVTILQLIGFNFKDSIGEPLTELVARYIFSAAPTDEEQNSQAQRLAAEVELEYLKVARDPAAYERLQQMASGRG